MARKRMGLQIRLSGDWIAFHKWVSAFSGEYEKSCKRAIKLAVQYVLSEVIRRIKAGDYEHLSSITLMMRDAEGFGSIPLQRTGALIRAITTDVHSSFSGSVGVLKNAKVGKSGQKRDSKGRFTSTSMANIAVLLHDGGTVPITDKMRQAFARRLAVLGIPPRPSGGGKSVLRIKPRPFIGAVFEDPAVQMEVQNIFIRELQKRRVIF